jgi:integrase
MDVTKIPLPAHKILSHEEIAIIEQEIALRDTWYLRYFQFALYTGMRRGEILALTWHDIDLWCNRELIVPDPKQPYYRDSGLRRVPIDEKLLGLLLDLRSPSRWVFQKTGRRMLGRSVSMFFRDLSGEIGITVNSERIRLTFAMNQFLQVRPRSRRDWKILQHRLGHRDLYTTRSYFARHLGQNPAALLAG